MKDYSKKPLNPKFYFCLRTLSIDMRETMEISLPYFKHPDRGFYVCLFHEKTTSKSFEAIKISSGFDRAKEIA